jgi:dTDP-4-dehydrorhamnose 3,5-epimerase
MSFEIEKTEFPGLNLIRFHRFQDARGEFKKILDGAFYRKHNLLPSIEQLNFSQNPKAGTLRGLHYQKPPVWEKKILFCLAGEIFDVGVDLRRNSPTYMKSFSMTLNAEEPVGIIMPKGFAHGYLTLQDNSSLLYFCDEAYQAGTEGIVRYNDPRFGIKWPMQPTSISAKDSEAPLIDSNFAGYDLPLE